MPIRFRCAYCNQLMAIARRKAGTVVRCPTCSGQVVVPSLESAAQAPMKKSESPNPPLFEQSDFDDVFTSPAPPPPPPQPQGFPAGPGPGPAFDVEPLQLGGVTDPLPGFPQTAPGLVLTPLRMLLLFLVIAVLMGLAFLAGFLIGKGA